MAKYKEQTASGETWVRSSQITVDNQLSQNPRINFKEERAVALGPDEVVTKPVGVLSESMTADNLSEMFSLINPETGEEIPEQLGTYQQVQVFLHSLYIHMAKKRDRGPQPYPSWVYDDINSKWIPPTPKPEPVADSAWGWDEINQQWIEAPLPPDDGQTYLWDGSAWFVWTHNNI